MSADDIAQVSALLGTEPIEFLVADGAAYIRWPFLGQSLGVATDWLMLPAEAIETAGAEVGASTDQLFEPTAFLTLFQEMADVAEVGREKVRGVETTHYRGVLDLRTVAQAYGLEEQIGAPATLGIAEDDLTALLLVPVDLWIDDADRLRRIEMRWDLGPVADVSEAVGITFSFELYAFGEPVTIALPAPDEVTDISDILLSSLSEVGDAVAFDGAAAGGGVYGSDPDLDALWDACAAGDLSACDRLYFESPVGSEYERFGDTCGEQREPGGLCAGRGRRRRLRVGPGSGRPLGLLRWSRLWRLRPPVLRVARRLRIRALRWHLRGTTQAGRALRARGLAWRGARPRPAAT